MSVQTQQITLPTIRIQSASPIPFDHINTTGLKQTIAKVKGLQQPRLVSKLPKSNDITDQPQKRNATFAELPDLQNYSNMTATKMARHGSESSTSSSSSSSKKHVSSPSSRKSKSSPKDVDWTDVTDPEERRRIQNRIAQRKFREKARENKEKAERELRNQEHAGNSYRIPSPADFSLDNELSGLPWGSVSWGLVMSRGHEVQSRRSSGRGTYIGDDPYSGAHYVTYGQGLHQTPSYGSSGGEEAYYDDTNYAYDPAGIHGYTTVTQ